VAKPLLTGFGGTFETKEFTFIFFKSGILRQISCHDSKFGDMPLRDLQWKLHSMKSLISTNEAYQLATNWLDEMVDVQSLEKKYQVSVQQTYFYTDDPEATRREIKLLPIFHVDWIERGAARPAVRVAIFGPTKELLGIYQEDDTFSKRPRNLLKNTETLLAIADDVFAKLSPIERRTLARRFSAVPIPDYIVSDPDSESSPSPSPSFKSDTGPNGPENKNDATVPKLKK
jgi:hypothetical protein